jgi:hypothetical protein
MLLELINVTLCKRPLDEKVFEGASEADWQRCFDLALQQNVLAMIFPAMSSLPKELRPSFTLWSKWMAYTHSVAEQSQHKRQVVEKMGSWLVEEGLTTTILKGFSLSALYPNPNLREFSDIDIFSGENYEAVNACFAKHGENVNSVDGHHAYLKVDGISVEHHFAFSNTKVKDGLTGPEDSLQRLVVKNPQPTSIPGINFPNPVFTALFVGWHAYEHFLQEKIELRHVIDLALALRQLSEQEAKTLNELKNNTGWGEFCDTLTAIAVHQIGLPQEWFPKIEPIFGEQEQLVWNDIINSPRTPKSKSSNFRRIYIAKRMLKNSWKFKEYSNISATELLIKETIGHFKTKKSLTFNQ